MRIAHGAHVPFLNAPELLFVAFVLSAAVTFNQHLHSENLVKIGVRKMVTLSNQQKSWLLYLLVFYNVTPVC